MATFSKSLSRLLKSPHRSVDVNSQNCIVLMQRRPLDFPEKVLLKSSTDGALVVRPCNIVQSKIIKDSSDQPPRIFIMLTSMMVTYFYIGADTDERAKYMQSVITELIAYS